MSKYIVSVFEDEKSVYTGARALQDLDNEATVTLYEGAVIAKDAEGEISVKDWQEEAPFGALTGMLLGSLVGRIAGPAGMAVGALSGSFSGMLLDVSRAGVSDEFLDDVAAELTPGKFALVAEIDEGWTMPLESAMEAAGGVLFRAWRVDVEDEQIAKASQELKSKLDATRDELQAGYDKRSAKLKQAGQLVSEALA